MGRSHCTQPKPTLNTPTTCPPSLSISAKGSGSSLSSGHKALPLTLTYSPGKPCSKTVPEFTSPHSLYWSPIQTPLALRGLFLGLHTGSGLDYCPCTFYSPLSRQGDPVKGLAQSFQGLISPSRRRARVSHRGLQSSHCQDPSSVIPSHLL